MNILVKARGYIGDVLFQSSIAKKLKEKFPRCEIHYDIPVVQPKHLLQNNPYIDFVWWKDFNDGTKFDLVIDMPEVDQAYPATLQFQAAAGIEDQSVEYEVYTSIQHDLSAHMLRDDIEMKAGKGAKIIGWQKNWEWRAYQCTPETLRNGIGAPHRNIEKVIKELQDHYIMLDVGFDRHVDTTAPVAQNPVLYSRTASLIKMCDWFIGAEGGLSNLAAGVGTKCIITTDFIEQNYGPNGRIRKCNPPMMGPATYFPDAGHVHLDPCITDDDIAPEIVRIING
jgi:hypothetical protein